MIRTWQDCYAKEWVKMWRMCTHGRDGIRIYTHGQRWLRLTSDSDQIIHRTGGRSC